MSFNVFLKSINAIIINRIPIDLIKIL
jgi:hypothetical protein